MLLVLHFASAARDAWVTPPPAEVAVPPADVAPPGSVAGAAREARIADAASELEELALASLLPSERVCVACRSRIGGLRGGRGRGRFVLWATKTAYHDVEVSGGSLPIHFSWPVCLDRASCRARVEELADAFRLSVIESVRAQALPSPSVFSILFGIYAQPVGEDDMPIRCGPPPRVMRLPLDVVIAHGSSRSTAWSLAEKMAREMIDSEVVRSDGAACGMCGAPATKLAATTTLLVPSGGRFADFRFHFLAVCSAAACSKSALRDVKRKTESLPATADADLPPAALAVARSKRSEETGPAELAVLAQIHGVRGWLQSDLLSSWPPAQRLCAACGDGSAGTREFVATLDAADGELYSFVWPTCAKAVRPSCEARAAELANAFSNVLLPKLSLEEMPPPHVYSMPFGIRVSTGDKADGGPRILAAELPIDDRLISQGATPAAAEALARRLARPLVDDEILGKLGLPCIGRFSPATALLCTITPIAPASGGFVDLHFLVVPTCASSACRKAGNRAAARQIASAGPAACPCCGIDAGGIQCSFPGCAEKDKGGEKLMKQCSRCKNAWYCSGNCQKAHWPTHKAKCC
ncbi:hypothetical protein DFJ74DRAFT_772613 [Hyaloraphidium curvatum]|nr:hypothetical protein DFJ74DRAFT_772613 [Hyaloraphidium curvatum]